MKQIARSISPITVAVAVTATFLLLAILLPANRAAMQTYHLSASQYHILIAVVELPLLATWIAAFYGYSRLEQYFRSIQKTAEGPGFERLSRGCHWLAWSLVAPSLVSLVANGIANAHPGFHSTALILGDYLNVAFPLVAFTLIIDGSHTLLQRSHINLKVQGIKALMVIFATLASFYCYLTFHHLNLQSATSTANPYYLPIWLLIFTIIIPYLYAWSVGLLAVYEINLIATHANGFLYRQAMRLLSAGLGLVVLASIGGQYLHGVVPRTGHLSINTVLLAVYFFYLVIILGFVCLSLGANRLKRIEEI